MTAYHCDSNAILVCPFKTKKDNDRISVYYTSMHCIAVGGHKIDRQILNNKVSVEYKCVSAEKWKVAS